MLYSLPKTAAIMESSKLELNTRVAADYWSTNGYQKPPHKHKKFNLKVNKKQRKRMVMDGKPLLITTNMIRPYKSKIRKRIMSLHPDADADALWGSCSNKISDAMTNFKASAASASSESSDELLWRHGRERVLLRAAMAPALEAMDVLNRKKSRQRRLHDLLDKRVREQLAALALLHSEQRPAPPSSPCAD